MCVCVCVCVRVSLPPGAIGAISPGTDLRAIEEPEVAVAAADAQPPVGSRHLSRVTCCPAPRLGITGIAVFYPHARESGFGARTRDSATTEVDVVRLVGEGKLQRSVAPGRGGGSRRGSCGLPSVWGAARHHDPHLCVCVCVCVCARARVRAYQHREPHLLAWHPLADVQAQDSLYVKHGLLSIARFLGSGSELQASRQRYISLPPEPYPPPSHLSAAPRLPAARHRSALRKGRRTRARSRAPTSRSP